jgi:uncharacterized Zn-binding protein involved in type VI secretion
MPAVVRLNDLSAGIDGAPTPASSASENVFVNNRGVHRNADSWVPHGAPLHSRISVGGSNNVFVNNLRVMRVNDTISCGDRAGQGSPNVFCNG